VPGHLRTDEGAAAGVIVNVIGRRAKKFPTKLRRRGGGECVADGVSPGRWARALRLTACGCWRSIRGGGNRPSVMLAQGRAKEEVGRRGSLAGTERQSAFGRPATPREIGNAVAFLASSVSTYTTGTVLTIDGGG